MSIFLDTSALLAILDADDQYQEPASKAWENLVLADEDFVCTNYVLIESFALLQNRLGMDAIRTLQEDIVPLLRIDWIGAQSHISSVVALLAANRRQLSLVDSSSFEAMRRLGITTAFTFDQHFTEQGFNCIP